MKTETFKINPHGMTRWTVKVFVHPSKSSMMIAQRKTGKTNDCEAFCRSILRTAAFEDSDKVFAELHFYRHRKLSLGTIIHEAVHATMEWSWYCQLNTNSEDGEESFSESVEYLVSGIRFGLKKYCRINLK